MITLSDTSLLERAGWYSYCRPCTSNVILFGPRSRSLLKKNRALSIRARNIFARLKYPYGHLTDHMSWHQFLQLTLFGKAGFRLAPNGRPQRESGIWVMHYQWIRRHETDSLTHWRTVLLLFCETLTLTWGLTRRLDPFWYSVTRLTLGYIYEDHVQWFGAEIGWNATRHQYSSAVPTMPVRVCGASLNGGSCLSNFV